VRLRLVNGANARIFRLSFSDQRSFVWIASDNGLLVAPVERQSLSLAPGERAEIVVDFARGGPVGLVTAADDNSPMMGMMGSMGPVGPGGAPATVMRFEPDARKSSVHAVPQALAAANGQDAEPVRRRRFVLTMSMPGMGSGMGRMGPGGMMGGGRGGMGRRGGGMGSGMAVHGIDGRAFDMQRIDHEVKLGDTEVWEVAGDMMWHPFHVHGVRFKVLRRNGQPPGIDDQGWRDTVLVREPVELLVKFTQPSRDAPFMYHCHILEHEDNGMMGQFTVA
jgi:FtsP/CotA-like multicopper oxidase with cupredoxin domain